MSYRLKRHATRSCQLSRRLKPAAFAVHRDPPQVILHQFFTGYLSRRYVADDGERSGQEVGIPRNQSGGLSLIWIEEAGLFQADEIGPPIKDDYRIRGYVEVGNSVAMQVV